MLGVQCAPWISPIKFRLPASPSAIRITSLHVDRGVLVLLSLLRSQFEPLRNSLSHEGKCWKAYISVSIACLPSPTHPGLLFRSALRGKPCDLYLHYYLPRAFLSCCPLWLAKKVSDYGLGTFSWEFFMAHDKGINQYTYQLKFMPTLSHSASDHFQSAII